MDNTLMTRESDQAAQAAVSELTDFLQQAHFAARRLEQYLPHEREDRLVDRIHAVRMMAEHLRARLEPSMGTALPSFARLVRAF